MKKNSKGRGRPEISDVKRIKMRKEIAAVASQLFQTQGYSFVSMRRIASEIGCSPMTLYKYYDAKIDILHVLWADIFNEVFQQMEGLDKNEGLARDYLNQLTSIYVNYWLTNIEHYRLVFMSEGVTQNEVSFFLKNPELASRYQIIATSIMALHQNQLSLEDIKLKTDLMICVLHGIAHNLITISGYPWSDAEKLIHAFIDGIE